MIAGARQTARRLRRRALSRIHALPALREEYRRMRRAHRDAPWPAIILYLMILCGALTALFRVFAYIAEHAARAPNGSDLVFGLASLFGLWFAWLTGTMLIDPLRKSRLVALLAAAPVSDAWLAGFQSRVVFNSGVFYTIVGTAWYGMFARQARLPLGAAAACVALGIVWWQSIVACGYLMAAVAPRWMDFRLTGGSGFGQLVGFGCVVLALPNIAGPVIESAARGCYYLLPTGWVHGALHLGLLGKDPRAWWLLVPTALLLSAAPFAGARVRARYIVREISLSGRVAEAVMEDAAAWRSAVRSRPPEERLPTWLAGQAEDDGNDADPRPTELARQRVLEGAFLEGRDWRAGGPVERAVAALLSPRERLIAELLTAGAAQWTSGVRRSAIATAVVAVLVIVVPPPWKILPLCAIFGLLALLLMGVCPAARWRALDGKVSPAYAHVPLDYREVLRVVLVIGTVRAVFLLPLMAALGISLWHAFDGEIAQGAMFGLKLGLVYVALHYYSGLIFARPYTDGRTLLRRIPGLLRSIALLIAFLGAVIAFLVPFPQRYVTTLSAGAIFGVAWLDAWFGERQLLRKPIDLVGFTLRSYRDAWQK